MKHNLLKSVIISVILLMGVSNAWADKTVWIDVSEAPSGYTNQMLVHYWGGSKDSYVSASSYGTVGNRSIYKAEIPDDATKWQVCRGDNSNKYNYQNEQTYATNNKYYVKGWDNSGDGTKVIGMIKGGHIYFDNSTTSWTGNIQFVIGHNNYSRTYEMTQVEHTQLWYVNLTDKENHEWNDATYYGFIANSTKFEDANWGSSNLSNATKYTAAYTSDYSLDSDGTYYCKPSSATNGKSFTITYVNGYSAISKNNATQAAKLRNDITSAYAAVNGTWPTTLKLQGTYLSGNGSSARNEISGTASSNAENNRVYGAVVTGKITHTYSTITGNYIFEGWGTGNTPSTTNAYYEYNITANTTVYAFFTKAYAVTFGKKGESGSSSVSATATANSTTKSISSGTKVAAGSTIKLTATPASGYRVVGWYSDANCTNQLQNGGNTYSAGTLTAAKTIYVKFEETKYDVTIQAGANGSVSPSGVKKVGNVTLVTITATANNGYTFKNWTKTGNVTITDAKSASTTIKATGTGTVTANFETAKRIYLKPAGDNNWANGTPRYAVYVIDDETWRDMTKINDGDGNTGNDIYYCDIKSTDQKVIFCRMDPSAAANNWENRWTQTENLTLPDNCNLFDIDKDANTEKNVNATGTWMEYNAWHLTGAFNEWALCGQTFKKQEDGSFTFTQHLELGTYEFKLLHNGDWYGNNRTMERSNCSAWTMSTNDNNCKITADYAGNYTFTFNANTKKLTVTYPTAHKMTFGIDNAAHGTLKVQINYENVTESGKYWYPGTKFVFSYEINKGYLFKGWNTKQNGTGEWLSTDITYTHTLTEDATVYAIFEDGYHITVGNTKYYFIDHNGKQINKLYIELGADTTYNSPLYKGTTKVDNGGTYTSTVAGTYTCELNNTTSPTGVNWTPPYANGDYRLLYIEQEVGLEGGLPKTTITYSHPSDIVRKSNTSSENVVSLHIFNKMDGSMDAGGKLKTGLNSPEIILQQYNASNDTWEDIACHMIFGPLRAGFMHAGMPGRKNASLNSSIDDLLYDNGIEVIKNDQIDNGSGVWDFTVYQDGTTATLDLTDRGLKRYTGKYYIRTSAAKGQWSNYTIPENEMTESTYASDHFRLNNPYHEENEYFTHYFCEYVNKTITSNVKFVVANEHGMAISKEFTKDDFTDAEGNLAGANTNVRWSWNQITNKCKRAYIAGSFDGDNEFLVVNKENDNVELQPNTNGKTGYFNDNTNWLYYADIKSKPLAKVQVAAKYNDIYQYFMGAENGENQYEQLIGGTSSDTKYPVRIIYDFKEHRFVVAYLPQSTITGDVAIETSVMLLRTNHGETNQIALNNNERITAPVPAYGAITFTEQHLTGSGSQYEKMLYWVSFPFDVALPDVFGLGKYGTDWIMEYYDGDARSITGLTTYNTFWKYITDETETLKAGVGYVLCLNVNKVNEHFLDAENKNEEVTLYFPSKESISWGDITKQGEKTISLTETKNSVSSETDHNWHLIGVPSYANTGESANTDNTDFLYQYDATDNSYDAKASEGVNFQALHAYMVQHAGDIRWTNYIAPSPIAARNNTDAVTHTLRLELQDNGSYADQTFIKLTDEENPTLDFDMNRDLPKIINTGANVYSLIQERNIQLAGNVMPVANTTIPLGVVIAAAGEYTFAMPEGTDGIVVELIDYQANTTTNLLFNDYTVNLPKGTNETRFALSVKPDKTATSLENIFNEATGDEVKKYIIDGVLYMQKDGVLYDAQGHIVR